MPVKKVVIDKANRVYQLPPPLFRSLHKERKETRIKRTEFLNFARFSWPVTIDDGLKITPESIKPASEEKIFALKEELATWFDKTHGVSIDPDKEIYVGTGIRNIILNLGLAFIDRGELVFVPNLCYPHYRRTIAACGGESVSYPMSPKSDWLPDFENLSSPIGRIARLLILNSPHNPTGAFLSEKELNNLTIIAAKENVMIINDAAYQSLSDTRIPSLLSGKGGTKSGAELYSFSYTFGLPSLPFGFVAGHSEIINGLQQIANLSPQTVLNFYCDMAVDAIRKYPNEKLKKVKRQISDSRGEAMKLMDVLELEQSGHNTVPFVWGKLFGRRSASTAANALYHAGKIVALPGTEFGESGEGFLRFSLTALPENFVTARQRVAKKRILFKLTEEI